MSTAGKKSKVYASGTAVPFTAEPCTRIGTTLSYQINTSAKRILDPSAAITPKIGGVAQPASALTQINPYFGIFTFASLPGGAVTVDASSIPIIQVANLNQFNAKVSGAVLKPTVFGDTHEEKALGLKDATGDFTGFDPLSTVIDSLASVGHQSLYDWWNSEDPKLLEFDPDGSGTNVLRTWAQLEGFDVASQVSALVTRKTTWGALCRELAQFAVPVVPATWGAP